MPYRIPYDSKKVYTYLKPAINLKKGDQIITSRSTVAVIDNTEVAHDSTNRLCVHVFCNGKDIPVTGVCFLANEMVLVIE